MGVKGIVGTIVRSCLAGEITNNIGVDSVKVHASLSERNLPAPRYLFPYVEI